MVSARTHAKRLVEMYRFSSSLVLSMTFHFSFITSIEISNLPSISRKRKRNINFLLNLYLHLYPRLPLISHLSSIISLLFSIDKSINSLRRTRDSRPQPPHPPSSLCYICKSPQIKPLPPCLACFSLNIILSSKI